MSFAKMQQQLRAQLTETANTQAEKEIAVIKARTVSEEHSNLQEKP